MGEVTKDMPEVVEIFLHSLELAIDDPPYNVTYTTALGTSVYALDLTENPPSKEGARNMDFEVVFPFYTCVSEIIEKLKTSTMGMLKIDISSREHRVMEYTCEFPLGKWSYTKMDEIMDALADQLTMKENLNRGQS